MAKLFVTVIVVICAFAGVALAALAGEIVEYGSGLQLLLICSAAVLLGAVAVWTGLHLFK